MKVGIISPSIAMILVLVALVEGNEVSLSNIESLANKKIILEKERGSASFTLKTGK